MADHVKMHKVKARTFQQEMKDEGFSEKKASKPSIRFDFTMLPDGKKWENGPRYHICLEGPQIGMRNDDGKGHVEIEVDEIGGRLAVEKKKGKRVLRKV